MISRHGSRITVALALALTGCYSNVETPFPEGFEPWEEQVSNPAPATADDACPEMPLVHVESHGYQPEGARTPISSVHASSCIHAPIEDVWEAMQDPQTGRDPTLASWSVTDGLVDETCDAGPEGGFQTALTASQLGATVEFRLCWRLALASGTQESPDRVVVRWQKVWGTSAISTLEGTLVASRFEGDPDGMTRIDYQYHLLSASVGPSNYETIHTYLDTIYPRLLRRAHGEILE